MPYNLDEWDLLAWSIAWEGSICLIKQKNSNARNGFQYTAGIEILNKNKCLLEKMRKIIPLGKIYPNRQYWQWQIVRLEDVDFVLMKIIPKLPSKQEKAKIVLEFVKSRLNKFHLNRKYRPYSKEEMEIYQRFKECI